MAPRAKARKTPQQERSRQTVESVLEAAAQVFARLGYANTTTNHIAARAGVSIGSLYQYFPSKDSILLALAERHLERTFAAAMQEVGDKRNAPVPELLRALVDALVQAHQAEPRLHRVIFEEARLDASFRRRLDDLEGKAMQIARELIEERCAELAIDNPGIASLLVVQILEAVTHSMVVRHPDVLRTSEFREELVTLLVAYLTGTQRIRAAKETVRRRA
jgi:AcrR family transcriptional regulator